MRKGPGNVNIFDLIDIDKLRTSNTITLNAYKAISGELAVLKKDFKDTTAASIKLFGEVGIKPEKEKKIKVARDVFRELNEDIAAIKFQFDQGFIDPKTFDTEALNRYNSALKELFDLKQGATSPDVRKIAIALEPIQSRINLDEAIKEKVQTISRGTRELPTVTIPVNLTATITTDAAIALADYNTKLQQSLAIGEKLGPVFENAFAAIANGQNVFTSIGNSIKQLVIQLASAAIRAAIFSIIIKTITGGAASAFNFKSLFASFAGLPKFADGVSNFRGGAALVGERGPEIVQLPQGSNVIPNHRLNQIGAGSMNIAVSGYIQGRGSDLLVVIDRATQQQGRRG